MTNRDPVETRAEESRDLYDVATWEPRTALDRLSVKLYGWSIKGARWLTFLVAFLITIAILLVVVSDALGTATVPTIGILTLLSALPALALAAYVYVSDVTTAEPLELLVATFILSVLFASFAAVINSVFSVVQAIPFGFVFMYYLVVGPVEEAVKLLSVRLYAYRKPSFDAVIDGAVYGAIAGLGFATIENVIYISQGLSAIGPAAESTSNAAPLLQGLALGTDITATRALAGPGHVIYSAFAGYYLGLAKFNPDRAGPIVVKGLLIAAFIHATYNTLVGVIVGVVNLVFPAVPVLALFLGFVLVYQGFFGYLLYRKIVRYRRVFLAVHDDAARDEQALSVEQTEFDS